MTIELLSPEQHAEILNAYENYPELFLQNKGYEYINRKEISDSAKEQFTKVESILKDTIKGFVSFSNFCRNKNGELSLRVQYHYDQLFIGVGYILLSELLNGFGD